MKIFAFPFAGGDSFCYRDFQKQFSPNQVETLSLPGRGRRFSEKRIESIDMMAEEAIKQFGLNKAQDYIFYGHSMGALIAYRTVIKLREKQFKEPFALFFSGRKGACLNDGKGNRHLLPSREFRKELDSLGGCPKEVLDNKELMEIFEPILRSDFKAVESFLYESNQKLKQKIVLFHGKNDHVKKEQVLAWQNDSELPVELVEFEGNHFFIFNEWAKIADIIKKQVIF